MGFQLSPGVNVSEIDLTGIVPSVATTDVGFCGVFRWGPLNEIVLLSNENQLVQRFGKPSDDTAVSFFTCANVLAYTDKIRVVRVADSSSKEHTKTVSSTGTDLTGTGFLADLKVGSTVSFGSEVRTVVEVASDTAATLDAAFDPDLADNSVIVSTFVGARNATAEGPGLLIKNDDDFAANYANGLANDGAINYGEFAARFAGDLGNTLLVSLCPSKDAYKRPLHVNQPVANNANITRTGTDDFTTLLAEGTIIKYNGLTRYVVSVNSATSATLNAPLSTDEVNTLTNVEVEAKWAFADAVGVAPGTSEYAELKNSSNDELHVVVVDRKGSFTGVKNAILERFSFLSKASDAKSSDGAAKYYVDAINKSSKYIRVLGHPANGTNWGQPADQVTSFAAPAYELTRQLANGLDVNDSDRIDAERLIGYDLFANAELVDISFLCGGEASAEIALALISICETRKDCIALLSPPKEAIINNPGYEAEDAIKFRQALATSTSYAVMDSGWKYQYDKYNDNFRWLPLNGDIAGLCVRTDTNQDPWWSPAGLNRGQIKNCVRLAYSPFKAQRDDLYQAGINPVTSEKGQGTVLYGDKTLLEKPSAFDRINVRRLFIVLEKAIARAAKFMLFEFNDEFTRAQFRNLVEPYLRDVQGRRGIYDFRVVCDTTNNTPEVIDRNEFVGDIYIKPARSINFIQLNFVAVRTGVEFNEVVGKF